MAVDDLLVENGCARGVVTNTGIRFHSKTVVLSAGTFLNGLVHIGLEHFTAGRMGDPASVRLGERLKVLMLAPLTSLVVKYSGEILIPPLLFP